MTRAAGALAPLDPEERVAPTPAPRRPPARTVALYAKREHIYQKEVDGRWQRLRAVALAVLAAVFFVQPWLTWNGRQALWFDLPARQFHVYGLTFWPQDFIFLSWLLIIAAFSLFFFTALAGRLWCGYACPQTVWTKVFMWVEWLTEGDRNARMRLDRAPWSARKLARKVAKHGLWLVIATVVSLTFVGYFSPIRELVPRLAGALTGWETFFLAAFTAALYLDAGWMREQICTYACPYARFQGAMFDPNTLTIFYDRARGEPRGHRRRGADPRAAALGDCIDCGLCVRACPTGIDIRNGTQYECIGCAACIDACDSVMDDMGYAPGLIRYTTATALSTGRTRILRPRLVAYGVVLAAMIGTFAWTLAGRVPLRVDVLHDRARLYRLTTDGQIENTYTLKIMNLDQRARAFRISADAIPGLTLVAPDEVRVDPGAIGAVAVRVQVPPESLTAASQPVAFDVRAVDAPEVAVREESRFLAPRRPARGAG